MSLAELRSKSKTNLTELKDKAKKENQRGSGSYGDKDPRFWTLERDETGEAAAIIRFLPTPFADFKKDGAQPWVKILSHGFKNEANGKWYIENSLTTIDQKDPVFELNRKLYNDKKEEQAKAQKRQTSYYSNIYIVRDPRRPENEGKVFLFRYGKKIFDKILSALSPDEDLGEEAKDPFDFWSGMDFKLKIKTVDKYPNYDSSEFASSKVISSKSGELSDDEIEEVWKKSYSLLEFLDPSNFKTYEELKARLDEVLSDEEPDAFIRTTDKTIQERRTASSMTKDDDSQLESALDQHIGAADTSLDSMDDIDKLLEDI